MQKLATTDVLTQLDNRMKIDDELAIKYANFKRYERVFSIIMLDIDYFKAVNDNYGHQIGDNVLKTISMILKKHSRSIDIVGRWGGEEFLIICGETGLKGAYILAENIRIRIESYPFEHNGNITVSLGIAQVEENLSIDGLIKNADKALYEAKDNGRNKSVKAT